MILSLITKTRVERLFGQIERNMGVSPESVNPGRVFGRDVRPGPDCVNQIRYH